MSAPAVRPVIALLTDFGLADPYLGMMKAAILDISPHAAIIDLAHDIQPQSVRQAAFLLGASLPFVPEDSITVAVVDPGVGTDRRPLALRVGSRWLVGPDNGLFSHVWDAWTSKSRRAYLLDRPEFWKPEVSDTFHGRDIFAPVAAHLAAGADIARLASPVVQIQMLPPTGPEQLSDGTWRLTIEHIDHFGNLVTNLAAFDVADPPDSLTFTVGAESAVGLASDYDSTDCLIALVGSLGYLEIAAPSGSAAAIAGANIGDPVIMSS